MNTESKLSRWIVEQYNEIIARMSIETPLVMFRGGPVSASEFLDAFHEAWAMPSDTKEAEEEKRDALEQVLPCPEESYAASCEAMYLRDLISDVLSEEEVAASELLSEVFRDMTDFVKSYYFLQEGGPYWWYR